MTVGDENTQGLSVGVSATPTCSWTATSQAGWIIIESGHSGTGGGAITYAVSDFGGGTSRTGTITIVGQTSTVTFTVTQVRCSATINPTTQTVSALGGTFTVAVTTQVGCGWEAVENLDWITVTNISGGRASGTMQYSVAFNAGAGRSGNIVVAGHTLTVNQDELLK
jgi:hypothetical protein